MRVIELLNGRHNMSSFWLSPGNRPARHCRRDLVYRTNRLPVARAAEGLSAVHRGARLGGTMACSSGSIFELPLQAREAKTMCRPAQSTTQQKYGL
jgi:hypothetical protein